MNYNWINAITVKHTIKKQVEITQQMGLIPSKTDSIKRTSVTKECLITAVKNVCLECKNPKASS